MQIIYSTEFSLLYVEIAKKRKKWGHIYNFYDNNNEQNTVARGINLLGMQLLVYFRAYRVFEARRPYAHQNT
jgi:hypothetical protein